MFLVGSNHDSVLVWLNFSNVGLTIMLLKHAEYFLIENGEYKKMKVKFCSEDII